MYMGPSFEFNGGAGNDVLPLPELRRPLVVAEALYSALVSGIDGSIPHSKISNFASHFIVRNSLFDLLMLNLDSDLCEVVGQLILELQIWKAQTELNYSQLTHVSLLCQQFTPSRGVSYSLEHLKTKRDVVDFICSQLELTLAEVKNNPGLFNGSSSKVVALPRPLFYPKVAIPEDLLDSRNSLGTDYIDESTDGDAPGEVRIDVPEQNADEDGPEITVKQNVRWITIFNEKWSSEKEESAAKMAEIVFKIVLPFTGAANWMLNAKTKHPASAASLSTSSSSSDPSWVVDFGNTAVILGFAFTLAGYGLRGKRFALCILMFQLGAFAAACGFINFMGSLLPQPLAGIVQCVALFVIAMAMAFFWRDPQ